MLRKFVERESPAVGDKIAVLHRGRGRGHTLDLVAGLERGTAAAAAPVVEADPWS